MGEHLAPILNTLVGHLWGYYAALSIHEGSRFLYRFHEELQQTIAQAARDRWTRRAVLDTRFREKVADFYAEFRRKRACRQFSGRGELRRGLGPDAAAASTWPGACRPPTSSSTSA